MPSEQPKKPCQYTNFIRSFLIPFYEKPTPEKILEGPCIFRWKSFTGPSSGTKLRYRHFSLVDMHDASGGNDNDQGSGGGGGGDVDMGSGGGDNGQGSGGASGSGGDRGSRAHGRARASKRQRQAAKRAQQREGAADGDFVVEDVDADEGA